MISGSFSGKCEIREGPAAVFRYFMKRLYGMNNHKKKHNREKILIGLILLVLIFLVSFAVGRYGVSVGNTVRILLSRVFHIEKTWDDTMEAIVLNNRLPRIILACLVGCSLSAAGAAYQGIFQNPMAAPDFLGASSGASLGATAAILLGLSSINITLTAFVTSLLVVALVILIGNRVGGNRIVGLVLAGIMISSLCSSGVSYLKLVADPNSQLPEITYWLMGTLNGSRIEKVWIALPVMLIGLIPLILLSWRINLLSMGDDEAMSLGVNAPRLRIIVAVCATLVTAASVAVSGVIGWVGLVIPHFARRIVGNNYVHLLPMSMIFGAGFLLVVDDFSRSVTTNEIPLGVLTAVIGAPVFIYLLLKREELS